jgi:hypothetical protein
MSFLSYIKSENRRMEWVLRGVMVVVGIGGREEEVRKW